MPRKIRDLVRDLRQAGFHDVGGGKRSHRKFVHMRSRGALTLSGRAGGDAKAYQEKDVRRAVGEVRR